MSSLQSRVLVAVIGVPVLVWVVLFAPTFVMAAALALLAGIGALELQKCVGVGNKDQALQDLSFVSGAAVVVWQAWYPDYMAIPLVVLVISIFTYGIAKAGTVHFAQLMAASFGGIAIGYSFAVFLRLYASGIHRAYLLLPFLLSFACDTFAYFAGRAFGKHKLAPKVSPKKTVEGSIGGMAGNVVFGSAFAFVMDRWFGGSIGYGAMAVLALACSIVAQIGDLSFSLIKREYGIKDYGRLFLEHGGVLDRFDSVLFVTPVIEIILNLVR